MEHCIRKQENQLLLQNKVLKKKKRLFVVFAVELNEFLGIGGIVNTWKPYEQLFDGITAHEMSVTYQHIKDKTSVRDYDEYNNIFRKAAREIKSKAAN